MKARSELLPRHQYSRCAVDSRAAERARAGLYAKHLERLIVSDFAAAEFVSVIARRVRTRETSIEDARRDLDDFEVWVARSTERTDLDAGDVATATAYLRRLDLTLLTPDALHIAIARRVGARLVTFDHGMAAAARALGMAVATP